MMSFTQTAPQTSAFFYRRGEDDERLSKTIIKDVIQLIVSSESSGGEIQHYCSRGGRRIFF